MATLTLPGTATDTSRYECIRGQLLERPLPSEDHAKIQLAIVTLLRPQVKRLNCTVLQEWTLDRSDLDNREWLTPDVLVVSNAVKRAPSGHALPPAFLAVEVISPGQSYWQMRQKALDYFSWGVLKVWIVDPESRSALTLSPQEPHEGHLIFDGGVLQAAELSLPLQEIFEFD